MSGQLPKEFYIDPAPGRPADIEHICTQATNRSTNDVVAVAVAPGNVAQAADLLFGTGVGVVSSIDDPGTELVDIARRSAAQGATEIALPALALDQNTILTRLRSRLGTFTPVTIRLDNTGDGVDLAVAERALRLGADYVSYAPQSTSPSSLEDTAALLAMASALRLGRVKITTPDESQDTWLLPETAALAARLLVPLTVPSR